MVMGLRNKTNGDRLKVIGLTTLEERRRRGDLIETFKLLINIEQVDYQYFFELAPNDHALRGHSMKLFVPR